MTKNTFQQKRQQGFTIIEVVLVLAIAGLIFLIVFLALPQLQESRRDTQRRNDAGRILSALESYASSNDGDYPDVAGVQAAVDEYAGDLNDPSTGDPYVIDGDAPAAVGDVQYATSAVCESGGLDQVGNSARDIAILMELENGTYCRDNK